MCRSLLITTCVLLATFTGQLYGQTCDVTEWLTENIAAGDNTCLVCVVDGTNVTEMVIWSTGSQTNVVTDTTPTMGRHVEGGQLVISDVTAFLNGAPFVEVFCSARGSTVNERVYPQGFFPPIVSVNPSNIVDEGGSVTLICTNNNIPGSSTLEWLDPQGGLVVQNFFAAVNNIQRSQAGSYECRVTRTDDGATISSFQPITVQYVPTVTSEEPLSQMAPLNGGVNLACVYDSIPSSDVTWFHNGTMLTGVVIEDNPALNRSELQLSSLMRNSGGNYTCTATNVVGSDSTTVSLVIQVPPAPATMLMAGNEGETTVDLSWTNNYNGLSPITGVSVTVITDAGSPVITGMMFAGDLSLQSLMLTGLGPFTTYNIDLSVVNVVGPSDSVNTTATTLSSVLPAPTISNFSALSSTELFIDWQPPTPDDSTTDRPSSWSIVFLDRNMVELETFSVSNPSTTERRIPGLMKGVQYSARVLGSNVRGFGAVSETVTTQTLVDAPGAPQNIAGMGVSAYGFELSWQPVLDNGGRVVTEYVVSYRVESTIDYFNLAPMDVSVTSLLLRNGGETTPPMDLMPNTTYQVRVQAINEAGPGDSALFSVTTQSLDQPQRIFDPPESTEVRNISAVISWTFPGGDVATYRVQYKIRIDDWTTGASVISVDVPGNMTTLVLTGLVPEADYDVRIQTINALGASLFSAEQTFTTPSASPPVVEGPSSAMVGDTVQVNCTASVDSIDLLWNRLNTDTNSGSTFLSLEDHSTAVQRGDDLIFTNPTLMDTGIYVCRLGSVYTQHTISFTSPPTSGPEGISTTVIIIVCVVGGVALLIFLGVVLLAIYCVCCSGSAKKSSNYSVKSKSKAKGGKGKRSMTWIETSTKFVPNTTPSYARADEPSAFDMPDDLQTHSSFNTLEKQNRVRHSPSPNTQANNYGNSDV